MNDAFPIDYEALKKGDVIPQEKIESVYQVKYRERPEDYGFKQMDLCECIRLNRKDLLAHVRCHGKGILIMSDQEAEAKTQSDIARAQRGIIRTTKRRASIDRTGFDETALKVAEYNDRQNTVCAMFIRRDLVARRRETAVLQLVARATQQEEKT